MNGTNHLEETDAHTTRLCSNCQRKINHTLPYDPKKRLAELIDFFQTNELKKESESLKKDAESLKWKIENAPTSIIAAPFTFKDAQSVGIYLAIFPVPLVAPFVPVRSDAVPVVLFCDEHAKNRHANKVITVMLSVGVIFIVASFVW